MRSQNNIPYFKFELSNANLKHYRWILADDKPIHQATNLNEFYMEFGYSAEISKAGILPDEFIWEEYIKDSKVSFESCMQMHIVEYLNKHSSTFKHKYGDQYDGWLAGHAVDRAARGIACYACRMKPFCKP